MGRVALVQRGPLADTLVVIVDIVDQNRALVDWSVDGGEYFERQMVGLKMLNLTDMTLDIGTGRNNTREHTYTHTHIYIYVCISLLSVCVCFVHEERKICVIQRACMSMTKQARVEGKSELLLLSVCVWTCVGRGICRVYLTLILRCARVMLYAYVCRTHAEEEGSGRCNQSS